MEKTNPVVITDEAMAEGLSGANGSPAATMNATNDCFNTARRTMDQSGEALWLAWGPGFEFYCNQACAALFSLKSIDLADKRSADIWSHSWPAISPVIESVSKTGQADWIRRLHLESPYSVSASSLNVDLAFIPVLGSTGSTEGVLVAIDINSEKLKDDLAKRVGISARRQSKTSGEMKIDAPAQRPESRYMDILTRLPAAIYTTDADGYLTYYNEATVKLWGRQPKIGSDRWCGCYKILDGDGLTEIPLSECPMAVAIKEKRKVTLERPVIAVRPDGSQRFFLPHPEPIFDRSKKMIGAVNMLIDVTDSKKAEEKSAMLAAIVQSSGDAIVSKTLESIVTSWNTAAERIFGYTAEEMIGQSIVKLIPPDRQAEETHILERIKSGEKLNHFETKRITKDGRLIDVSLTISPIKNSQGVIIGASKIARDITAQKEAERLILENEERLRMASESTNLGTWEFHVPTKKLVWSDQCKKIYGLPVDWEPDFDFIAGHNHPEDHDQILAATEKALDMQSGGLLREQYRIVRHNDGEVRWLSVQGKVFFNNQGQAERLIGTMVDVTESKLLEQRKDDFIKMASHELKTPITSINGYVQLLLRMFGEKEGKSQELTRELIAPSLNTIARQVSKLTRLVGELLDISKMESGMLSLDLADFDPSELVEETIKEIQLTIPHHVIVFKSNFKGKIRGDRDRIAQVLTNLVDNAVKYSPVADKVEVIVTKRESAVDIMIKDFGIGIEKSEFSRVFDRFYRVEGKSEQTYPGFGIGLYIANEIISRHGGKISLSSEKNKGSVFTVSLPVAT